MKLKNQLLISGAAGIVLLLLGIRLIVRGYITAAVIILLVMCVYVVLVNLWFRSFVTDPLSKLTAFSRKIADGKYGSQEEVAIDNEIGDLTGAINDMSKKIAIADKTRTEFISQISHELRTPLTAITGWSETIAYDPAVQGDSLRGINIITKEAERLTRMVAELLEFTRIQDGRFNLRIELIDIAAELEDALFTYGEIMRQAGISIHYDPPEEEIPLIPGDPERLKQVFCNLLDNAAKHGEGEDIDVTLQEDGNFVRICFRDYGHGIPEDELPHVKEKFYKGSSKNRGTGIGLSVCDEIISRHNGTLNIRNAEGGGCEVEITLPMSAD
ncbi:MAG: HAMP domain-containing histidine kinase [Oscillospiraceae bacterium]|nr:HAMP domain-containing histidine kinase [Oscillospiraceae bacterium]